MRRGELSRQSAPRRVATTKPRAGPVARAGRCAPDRGEARPASWRTCPRGLASGARRWSGRARSCLRSRSPRRHRSVVAHRPWHRTAPRLPSGRARPAAVTSAPAGPGATWEMMAPRSGRGPGGRRGGPAQLGRSPRSRGDGWMGRGEATGAPSSSARLGRRGGATRSRRAGPRRDARRQTRPTVTRARTIPSSGGGVGPGGSRQVPRYRRSSARSMAS